MTSIPKNHYHLIIGVYWTYKFQIKYNSYKSLPFYYYIYFQIYNKYLYAGKLRLFISIPEKNGQQKIICEWININGFELPYVKNKHMKSFQKLLK